MRGAAQREAGSGRVSSYSVGGRSSREDETTGESLWGWRCSENLKGRRGNPEGRRGSAQANGVLEHRRQNSEGCGNPPEEDTGLGGPPMQQKKP
jgi:hypothetical protein